MKKYVVAELKELIEKGKSLEQIGEKYGVTRQRMYQVFQSLGLQTLVKARKNTQMTEWTDGQKWLWNLLNHKLGRTQREEKLKIFNSIEIPTHCPVLGIELDYTMGPRTEYSPSLDQIRPGEGYHFGNVIIISWRANRIKNDGTPEEHMKIWQFYKK